MCYKTTVRPYCPKCGDLTIFKTVVTYQPCAKPVCEFRGLPFRQVPNLRSTRPSERPCTKCTSSRASKCFSIAGTGVSDSDVGQKAIADEVKARLRKGSFQKFQPGRQFVQTKINAFTKPLPDLPELDGVAVVREVVRSRDSIVAINASSPAELDGVAIIREIEAAPSVDAIVALNDSSPVEVDGEEDLVVFYGRRNISAARTQITRSSSVDSSVSDEEDGGVKLIVPARLVREMPIRQPRAPPTSLVAQKLGGFVRKDRFGIVIPRKTKPAQQAITPPPFDHEVETVVESPTNAKAESITESTASSETRSLKWSLEDGAYEVKTFGLELSDDESSDGDISEDETFHPLQQPEVLPGYHTWQQAESFAYESINEIAKKDEGFARFCKEHCVSVAPARSLSPPSLSSTPSPARSVSPETSLEWRTMLASRDSLSRSQSSVSRTMTPWRRISAASADLGAQKDQGFAGFHKADIAKDEGLAKFCSNAFLSQPRKATPKEALKWCTMMKDSHRKKSPAPNEPLIAIEEDESEEEDPEEMRYA